MHGVNVCIGVDVRDCLEEVVHHCCRILFPAPYLPYIYIVHMNIYMCISIYTYIFTFTYIYIYIYKI